MIGTPVIEVNCSDHGFSKMFNICVEESACDEKKYFHFLHEQMYSKLL